jgi:hypothetical protein
MLTRTAFVADIGEAESANTTVTRVLEAANLGLVDSVVINGDVSLTRTALRPPAAPAAATLTRNPRPTTLHQQGRIGARRLCAYAPVGVGD